MPSNLLRVLRGGVLLALMAGPVMAQTTGLPEQLFDTTRPALGDSIRICIDRLSVGSPFDHDVSQAIADALLLKPVFVDAPSGFGLGAEGYEDELRLAMTNSCDMMPGMSLQPDSPLLSWGTFTRSYAEIPFVFAVTDPAYKTLSDIPRTRTLGTALGSVGESAFLVYLMSLPKDQRWRRLPYADPRLMLKRLLDGTLGGMLIWSPSLSSVIRDNPAAADVRIIPTDPMPTANVSVGVLISARDTFLRSQVDQAIASLIADGTIQRLLDEHHFEGTPGTE